MIRSSDSICREENIEHQLASAGGNDPIHTFFTVILYHWLTKG